MKAETLRDIEKVYDQIQEFLAGEGPLPAPVMEPQRAAFQDRSRLVPEQYLLKDNLLLLLKES